MKFKKIIITSSVVLCLLLTLVLTNSLAWNSYSIPTEEDKQITVHDNQKMRLSATAQSTDEYIVTATVLPETAVDQTLNWRLKIKNSSLVLDSNLLLEEFIFWVKTNSTSSNKDKFMNTFTHSYSNDYVVFESALSNNQDEFVDIWLPFVTQLREQYYPDNGQLGHFVNELEISSDAVYIFIQELKGLRANSQASYSTMTLTDWSTQSDASKSALLRSYFNNSTVLEKFISLSISSDTKTCSLEYLKPFSFEIQLEAYSVSNSTVSAYCDLGCYERPGSIGINLELHDRGSGIENNIILSAAFNTPYYIETASYTLDFSELTYEQIINDANNFVNVNFTVDYIGTSNNVEKLVTAQVVGVSEIIDTGLGNNFFIDLTTLNYSSLDMIMYDLYGKHIDNCLEYYSVTDNWFNIEITVQTFNADSGKALGVQKMIINCIGFDVSEVTDVASIVLSNSSFIL